MLGVSWGGALAQQLAFANPGRCRRLVLVATATGALMVPPHPGCCCGWPPRGGTGTPTTPVRSPGTSTADGCASAPTSSAAGPGLGRPTLGRGYLYQLAAGLGWTSLPFLPLIRQRTLVLAGADDPIIPLVNARIMTRLLRDAHLHVYPDGHLGLLTRGRRAGDGRRGVPPIMIAVLGT